MSPTASSGKYVVYPMGADANGEGVSVWCDFDTADGNGWTIVYTASGSDSDVSVTSDVHVMPADDDATATYNLPRRVKAALSAGSSSQLLLWRAASDWLVLSGCNSAGASAVFGSRFASPMASERIMRCNAHSADASTGSVVVAWSTGAAAGHGDFAVLRDTGGFDRTALGVGAPLLNANCTGHVVYSKQATAESGGTVVVLGAAASFGSWRTTTPDSCGPATPNVNSTMSFRIGVRAGRGGTWTPLLRRATFHSRPAAPQQVRSAASAGFVDVTRVKVAYRDGYLTCADGATHSGWHPWDGCSDGYDVTPEEAGFSMDLYHNDAIVVDSPHVADVPAACTTAAEGSFHGADTVVCDTAVSVSPTDTMALRPHVPFSHSDGAVRVDVDGFVVDHCPVPAAPRHGRLTGCTRGSRWVKILSNASYTARAGGVYPAALGISGTVTVSAVRAVPVSGFLGCAASLANASDADMWNRCGYEDDDGKPIVLFELLVNGAGVVLQPAADENAAGCAVGPAGAELFTDYACATNFVLQHHDLVNVTWHDARVGHSLTDNTEADFVVDVWALVTPSTPITTTTAATAVVSDGGPRGRGWHMLVGHAWVDATQLASDAPPFFADLGSMKSAVVSRVRVVPRAGFLECNNSAAAMTDEDWVWNTCKPAAGEHATGGLDVKVNGSFVLEMPSHGVADAQCRPVTSGSGALTCDVAFTLHADDALTFSWFDAREAASLADNDGVLYFDVWGWLEERPTGNDREGSSIAPVIAHDVCTYQCDAGFSLVGSATQTCSSDGTWSSETPQCLALAPFELRESRAASVADAQRQLPSLHTWTFDAAAPEALTAVVDGSDSLGIGAGVMIGEGAPGTGCAVGHCATLTTCGAALRSDDAFDTTALGGNHPKSVSIWVRLPSTSSRPTSSPAVTPLVSFGGTQRNNVTGDVEDACSGSFGVALVDGVPVGRLGARCAAQRAAGDGGALDGDYMWPDSTSTRAPISTQRWTHVALTHDGHTTRLYVEGQLQAERAGHLATRAVPVDHLDHVWLGGDTLSWGSSTEARFETLACAAALDEVRITSFALSASEVAQLYHAGLRCPALVAPPLGSVECSGDSTNAMPGDLCTVHCAAGTTPSFGTRTCLGNGMWSGTTATTVCARDTAFEAGDSSQRPIHGWGFDAAEVVQASPSAIALAVADMGRAVTTGSSGVALQAGVDNMTCVSLVPHSMERTGVVASGNALHFHGTTCRVNAGAGAAPATAFLTTAMSDRALQLGSPLCNSSDSVTLSLWFRLVGDAASPFDTPLVFLGDSTAGYEHMAVRVVGGEVTVSMWNANASVIHPLTAEDKNGWVHVAVVLRDAGSDSGSPATTATLELYVGGALSGTITAFRVPTPSVNDNDVVVVGRHPLLNLTASDVMLDDVRVYDRAVSLSEVAALSDNSLGRVNVYGSAGHLGEVSALTTASTALPASVAAADTSVSGTAQLMHSGTADDVVTHTVTRVTNADESGAAVTNASSLTPGQHAVVYATVGVSGTFRCPSGGCPTVFVPLQGSAALVQLELTEEVVKAVADAHTGTSTVECHVIAPPGTSGAGNAYVKWSSVAQGPSTTAGVVTLTNLGLALKEPAVHMGMSPSTMWAMPAAASSTSATTTTTTLVCQPIGHPALNSRDEALRSCDSARQQAVGTSGVTVSSPSGAFEHRQPSADVPGAVSTSMFARPMPGVQAGDAIVLQAHTRVAADGGETVSDVRASVIGCASGEVRRVSLGDWIHAAPVSLRGVDGAVTLSFDARAESGSTLEWRVTQYATGRVVTLGDVFNGTLPGTTDPCVAANQYCRFEVPLSLEQVQELQREGETGGDMFVDLKPALPKAVAGGSGRAADRGVWLKRVMLSAQAPAAAAAIVIASEDWSDVGACTVASTSGGVVILYTVNASSPSSWQVRLVNQALLQLQSGACTFRTRHQRSIGCHVLSC